MFLVSGQVWAAPSARELSGRYRGELGTFRFTTSADGTVKGFYESGGACGFKNQQAVFDGSLQGNVFVGRVSLCQTGPGCEEADFYPVLAFVTRPEGALVAQMKLAPGCSSPGLTDGRLVLEATADEGADRRAATAAELASTARPVSKENVKLAEEAFLQAVKAITSHKYSVARSKAQRAISLNPNHAQSYKLLGVAEVRMNRVDAALSAFDNARRLAPKDDDVHYNMACAYARLGRKRDALASLQEAVDLGFADADLIATDRDLSSLRADPEFKLLVDKARKKRR